jgi:hypothetical protein
METKSGPVVCHRRWRPERRTKGAAALNLGPRRATHSSTGAVSVKGLVNRLIVESSLRDGGVEVAARRASQ